MKCWKGLVSVLLIGLLVFAPTREAHAFAILEIIKAAITKVIKAVDLAIQRQQNKVIWLQNAQKELENAMSKLKLKEIGEWTEKQKEQYAQYFDELRKVKLLISYYQRIRDITAKQGMLVREYQEAWRLLRHDKHFTPQEVDYMGRVYSGILLETAENIDQLAAIIQSFRTQMSDAKRLELINTIGREVDVNVRDLRLFNNENITLSIERSRDATEVLAVRKIYGLE
jgi:hypothetical protein